MDNALRQHIRNVALRAGVERYALSKASTVRIPVTDPLRVLTIHEAIHSFFMETAAYYLNRAEQGKAMSHDVSAQLLKLHVSVYEPSLQVGALTDAVAFFVHSDASRESEAVREAIKVAQLALLYDGSDDNYGTEPMRRWTLS